MTQPPKSAPAADNKALRFAFSTSLAMFNSLAFEGPGQAIMVHSIRDNLSFTAAVRKFVHEVRADTRYFWRVQLSSLVEAGIHRGMIKYTIMPLAREWCQSAYPSNRFVQVAAPTAAVVAAEATVIGPLSRGLISVAQKDSSNLFSGMAIVARKEGIRGLYKGWEQICGRTLAFTFAQNIGMTAAESVLDAATAQPDQPRPLSHQCLSAAVGGACGVVASMLNQVTFVEAHNSPGVPAYQIMFRVLTTPSQWSNYTGATLVKMAYKVPNIVILLTVPKLLADRLK